MFKRIAVAYNGTAEARRALTSGIHLAKTLGSELAALTLLHELPGYTAYAAAIDPSITRTLSDDRRERFECLQAEAREIALRDGVVLATHLLEGEEVDAIIGFLLQHKTDLLIIGLHRHSLHISRLWSSVYEVAQDAPCSVLGVH